MIDGRKWCAEAVAHEIVSHEERVYPGRGAAHQAISLCFAQRLKCAERGSEIVGAVKGAGWVIGDGLRHNEINRERWSYYDEFIKSNKIKKAREQYPDFDKFIVQKIRKSEIKRAVDVRDCLPAICVGPAKNLKRFVEHKIDFDAAYHNAMDAGGGSSEYKRLHGFRQWLAKADTEKDLTDTKEKNIRDKIEFELDKVEKRSKQLKVAMSKKTGSAKN